MPSLVQELQQDALDEKVLVSTLLRKAMAVASKLDISDADEWMKAELNGYDKGKDVPDYRRITGELKAKDIFGRFLPVIRRENDQEPIRAPIHEPLSSIEDLTIDERQPMIPLGSITDDGSTFERFLVLNPTSLRAIKDRVRSTVLEWALALEKKGISGEGLSFNPREKEAAKTVQNITNFTGPISGGAIVQHVAEGNANVAIGARLDEVASLVKIIRDRLPTLGLAAEQERDAVTALERLGEPTNEGKPSKGRLLAGLAVLSEILKTAKSAVDLQKPIHDLIEWASRLMS